jgi:hypothetical protein
VFVKVKSTLIGREIPNEINLLEAVTKLLIGISDAESPGVFRRWIKRAEKVTDAGGDCLIS